MRYRQILRRMLADPDARRYLDHAPRPADDGTEETDASMTAIADKLRGKHGARQREVEPAT